MLYANAYEQAQVRAYKRLARQGNASAATPEQRAALLAYQHAVHNASFLREMLRSTKAGASARGLSCELTLDDLQVLRQRYSHCPLTGTPLVYANVREGLQTGEYQLNRASLDRIDNNQGYSLNNCWFVSWEANKAKAACTLAIMQRTLAEAKERGLL
jgi:hypothetical protein